MQLVLVGVAEDLDAVEQSLPFAEHLEAQVGDHRSAEEQRGALDQVRPDNRFQTPVDRIGAGDDPDDPDADYRGPELGGFRRQTELPGEEVRDAENGIQRDGAGIEHRGHRHHHVSHHEKARHNRPAGGVVAVFQELGDGVDLRLQKARQQEPAHQHKRHRRHPLIAGDGHAHPTEGAARHAHEVLCGDVRGDQADADQPPGQGTSRQEVVFAISPLPGGEKRNHDHQRQKTEERDQVKPGKRHRRFPPKLLRFGDGRPR